MEQKRVFVGVSISEEARNAVERYIRELKERHPAIRARWLPPENLHITLRFVGNVSMRELSELDQRTRDVANRFAGIEAALEGTGNFAKRRIRSDALWIGIKGDYLAAIAGALADEEGRPFVPHLTIARLKDPRGGEDLVREHLASTFESVPFRIDELLIYESTLLPTGSVYSVLSKHQLKG